MFNVKGDTHSDEHTENNSRLFKSSQLLGEYYHFVCDLRPKITSDWFKAAFIWKEKLINKADGLN